MATPTVPASQSAAVKAAEVRAMSAEELGYLNSFVKVLMARREAWSDELMKVIDATTKRRVELGRLGQDTFVELADISKDYYKTVSAGAVQPVDALKYIIELSKLLSDSDDPVSIEVSANQVRFSFGGTVLISKLVDGKFPDYSRVIPKDQPKQLRLNRVMLLQSLQRAAILTSDKFRGVRWVLSDGSLKIICSNTEQEEAQEEIDVEYKGDSLDIGFNVGYLLDVLNHLDVSEILCSLGDANSSALITVPEKSDFKYVVMPMRI